MVFEPQIINMWGYFPPEGDRNESGFMDDVHVEEKGDCEEDVHLEGQSEVVVEG